MDHDQEANLRIPGPTPLPPEVREALRRQMINHRGPHYAELQEEVLAGLRHFFGTTGDVLLFVASGTGGLEAAIVNTLSPGDRVLAVSIGVFGQRFAGIAEAFGADVRRLEITWGRTLSAGTLSALLAATPGLRAVLLTFNETSTGVFNDLVALAPVVASSADPPPLLLVDAISALGAMDLSMDTAGVDVLVTASHKAWMSPPGIAMIGVSPRAWEAHAVARMPRYYFDFSAQRRAQARHQDAWTPAVSTMFALQAALRLMLAEGKKAIVARHLRLARQAQQGLEALGLPLFAEPGYRSRTVTAAMVPPDIDAAALIAFARTQQGVELGGGQDLLAGKIIRLGHMGWVDEGAIAAALTAIEAGLQAQGAGRSGGADA